MAKIESLSKEKKCLALNGKRSAALVKLSKLEKSVEDLPKDRSSVCSFERIKSRCNGILELCVASMVVTSCFAKIGGDPLRDPDFANCCDTAANVAGEVEMLGEGCHDKSKGFFQPVVSPVSQTELVDTTKTLAERTGQQTTAARKQARATLHHPLSVVYIATIITNVRDVLRHPGFLSTYENLDLLNENLNLLSENEITSEFSPSLDIGINFTDIFINVLKPNLSSHSNDFNIDPRNNVWATSQPLKISHHESVITDTVSKSSENSSAKDKIDFSFQTEYGFPFFNVCRIPLGTLFCFICFLMCFIGVFKLAGSIDNNLSINLHYLTIPQQFDIEEEVENYVDVNKFVIDFPVRFKFQIYFLLQKFY